MASTPNPPASRETLWAIIGSFVLSLVLATILAGNPFRALGEAYFDYTHEPSGVGKPAVTPPRRRQPQPRRNRVSARIAPQNVTNPATRAPRLLPRIGS